MRFRITYVFFESPMVGETYLADEFDAPNDEVAKEHFRHEARSGWQHYRAMLHRIDREEIVIELEEYKPRREDGDDASD